MKENQLSIHSENILPIIKKWLYSEKGIFLRELISNACDALHKLQAIENPTDDLKIDVTVDEKAKTITVTDNGIGMSEEEVEKYIAQIAFSGAEEFVEKFKDKGQSEQIIGHFGLGFYSSYMVASKVEIQTLSYAPDSKPVFWSCDGSSSYLIGEGKKEGRGTQIILHIDQESEEFLKEAKIDALLKEHCLFFPFPISLNGKSIDNHPPLWQKAPSECTDKEYLDFYRKLFPQEPEPIFWIHLNVEYPFNLKGILYFPKMHRRFDQNEATIKLFCNKVFVSDNCKDILPDFLMMLKGAIDSPDIPLNVSRSYLQVDSKVKQLSAHISKKVSDKLLQLYRSDKDKFIEVWPDVETIVKLGILQDDKFFDRIKEALIWKNSKGEWAPLEKTEGKIFYTTSETSPLLKLYKSDVIIASHPIDTPLIQRLEDKLSLTFQRIDGALDESLLDPTKEKTVLDADGKTESSKIAQAIKSSLQDVDVEAKSFTSDELPGLVVIDENQRRLRDYMSLTQGSKANGFPTKKIFVVNTNNPLIQTIYKLQTKKPQRAKDLAQSIYDLSLLSQKESSQEELESLIQRQTKLLQQLAQDLSQ